MKQLSFADAEYAGKRKQTRRERFLIEMDQVVPWKGLIALIKPHYPKGDAGSTGVDKRTEHQNRTMIWSIAARPSTYKKHGKQCLIARMRCKIEYAKAQVRAKVEHPFRVIKRQFGYTKVRFRGLAKNIAQQTILFALSNLWMVRKRLLSASEVRL
ncbi:transposase [Pseudomonas sp. P2663]